MPIQKTRKTRKTAPEIKQRCVVGFLRKHFPAQVLIVLETAGSRRSFVRLTCVLPLSFAILSVEGVALEQSVPPALGHVWSMDSEICF